MHPSAGHESGTLVNAVLYHCRLPAMRVVSGSQRRSGDEGGGGEGGGGAVLERCKLNSFGPMSLKGARFQTVKTRN